MVNLPELTTEPLTVPFFKVRVPAFLICFVVSLPFPEIVRVPLYRLKLPFTVKFFLFRFSVADFLPSLILRSPLIVVFFFRVMVCPFLTAENAFSSEVYFLEPICATGEAAQTFKPRRKTRRNMVRKVLIRFFMKNPPYKIK